MADDNAKLYAVLTGDLVKSSKLSPDELDKVRGRLLDGVATVATWNDGLVVGKAEFFRGDAWQLALADARYALRVALYLRSTLLTLGEKRIDQKDTRVAIGIGTVERLDQQRISLSTGQAFMLSGGALDDLKEFRLAYRVGEPGSVNDRLLSSVGSLCDALVRRWSQTEARYAMASMALPPQTQTEIATAHSVAPASVSAALKRAGWPAVEETLVALEAGSPASPV